MNEKLVAELKAEIENLESYELRANEENTLFCLDNFDFMRDFVQKHEGARLVLAICDQNGVWKSWGEYEKDTALDRQELYRDDNEDIFGAYNSDQIDELKDMFADKVVEAIHDEYFDDADKYLDCLNDALELFNGCHVGDDEFISVDCSGDAHMEGKIYGTSYQNKDGKEYLIAIEII